LPWARETELAVRLDDSLTPADGICALSGRDVAGILKWESGVRYALDDACTQLQRFGYSHSASCLRHEKGDPAARERFCCEGPLS
jgi:hypothetical protein